MTTIDLSALYAVLPSETVSEMQASIQYASKFGESSIVGDAFLYEGYMKAVLTKKVLEDAFSRANLEVAEVKRGRPSQDSAPLTDSEKKECVKALRDFTRDPELKVEFAYGKGYGNSRQTTYVRIRSNEWSIAGRNGQERSTKTTQSHLFRSNGNFPAITVNSLRSNQRMGVDLAVRV